MNAIVKRSDKLSFFGITDAEGVVTYHRMQGFNELATQKGPIEYSRQYIDQPFAQSDVVGYSPSMSYSFDQFEDDPVHEDLVQIATSEMVGKEAVRSVLLADLSKMDADGTCPAVKRDFSVICENEGNSTEAYTYSGQFKVKGEKVFGRASSTDDWMSCSFIAE